MSLPKQFKNELDQKLSNLDLTNKQKDTILDSLAKGKEINWNLLFSEEQTKKDQN